LPIIIAFFDWIYNITEVKKYASSQMKKLIINKNSSHTRAVLDQLSF